MEERETEKEPWGVGEREAEGGGGGGGGGGGRGVQSFTEKVGSFAKESPKRYKQEIVFVCLFVCL